MYISIKFFVVKSEFVKFFGIVIVIGCSSFVYQFQKSEPVSDWALANVEALARGESDAWEDCRGCSSEYLGDYCCTIMEKELRKPKDNEDKN